MTAVGRGCFQTRGLLKAITPPLVAEYTTRRLLRTMVSGQPPVCVRFPDAITPLSTP
jgi:hypothetical protein